MPAIPPGRLKPADAQYSIRFDASLETINRLRDLIVARRPDGGQVLLSDVAEVVDASARPTAINHINAKPSVGVNIQKQSDANAVDVSKQVKARIAAIEKQYAGEKLSFNIASDQSIYTLASANAVVFDLGLAVLIVSVVMLLFLHSFRSSLFVLVAHTLFHDPHVCADVQHGLYAQPDDADGSFAGGRYPGR